MKTQILFLATALMFSCGGSERPKGWTKESHGKNAPPNYDVVFAQNEVKEIHLIVSPTNWQAMLNNMKRLLGNFGSLGGGTKADPAGEQPTPEMISACDGKTVGSSCSLLTDSEEIQGICVSKKSKMFCSTANSVQNNACDAKNEGDICLPSGTDINEGGTCFLIGDILQCIVEGGMRESIPNPTWVPCTVKFEGKTWWHVGLRFKGNSSLGWAWSNSSYKLPLKLDFDEFETDYPEIMNQRFFGFKRLSLSNNALDPSYLRDKIAGDVFREGGVASPRRAFYRVFIHIGYSPIYVGLYTMAEVPARPMFSTQFGDTGGNLYKPEGGAASWKTGLSINEDSFSKKTNKKEADWSDVKNSIAALHASQEDPAVWRSGLEKYFDVDGFLRWLAINTIIQDWDTYGNMSHNYYLYGDPVDNDQLHWIPWDHNASFMSKNSENNAADNRTRALLSLDMSEVTNSWPLIRFLIDDPIYQKLYRSHVEKFITDVFSPDPIKKRFQDEHNRIAPYVSGPEGETPGFTALNNPNDFEASLDDLFAHIDRRYEAVRLFLGEE